jgi:hypothetical protein
MKILSLVGFSKDFCVLKINIILNFYAAQNVVDIYLIIYCIKKSKI